MIKSIIYRATLLSVVLLFFITGSVGQIPPGYYNSAAGKTGVALQAALHNIIKGHTVVSYSSIPVYFATTDVRPGSVVWDMYSDIPGGTPPYVYHYNAGDECGNYNSEGDCYNREHSWPASWFNDLSPMYSDMFHIYPTDGYVNNKRSNYPFGRVSSPTWTSQNGSRLGPCSWPGYNGTVFEPVDGYKGDFARSFFYMSTRYYTEDSGWPGSAATTGSQMKSWELQLMLHWSLTDPVSQKEIDRNNAVYGIQNNRNPFIDHPEYAYLIWGYPVGTNETGLSENALTVYPNPAGETCNVILPDGFRKPVFGPVLISTAGLQYTPTSTGNGNMLTLQLGSIPKGLYFLVLSDGITVLNSKVVKQ